MNFYSFYDKRQRIVNWKRRINLFLILFVLLFCTIVYKLFSIQIIDSEKYRYIAKKQSQTREIIVPQRGIIFDRNLNPLVSNIYKVSVTVDPYRIKNIDSVASVLSYVFGKSKSEYISKLTSNHEDIFYVERKAEITDLKGIDSINIDGLNIFKESSRYYTYGKLASQLIGFTDIDNKGVMGVELAFNSDLTGREGYMISQRDGRGFKKPDLDFVQKEPVPGNNVILTIDKNIQQIAEEEIENGVRNFNALKGKVVVLSVKTGEILAVCSYPFFNPNNITSSDSVGMRNSVISDIYEPGSTFKLVTAAGSLEEDIENPTSIINAESGEYTVAGMSIKDSYPSGSITFKEVIERSSNVGFAKISQKLGPERFYKYARDFGFGIYSGVELYGENKGYLKRPVDFTSGSLEYMSIGYQVTVNVLQLAMAYGAIANSGMLMKPTVIKSQLGSDGTMVFENKPSPVRQVISVETAHLLTELLSGVVERGTGTEAGIYGVKVAGKTGTSQRLINGEYSSSSHTSSFVGYFPAENPEILIAVVIDDPKNGYYGGKVSAPIFRNIAERVISYTGFNNITGNSFASNDTTMKSGELKLQEKQDNFVILPDFTDMKVNDALEILKEKNIKYVIDGKTPASGEYGRIVVVKSQHPLSGEKISIGESVKLSVKVKNPQEQKMLIVPDVRFMSLRKSINKLVSEGFTVDVNGSGEIIDQYPKPGTKVPSKSRIIVFCKNIL